MTTPVQIPDAAVQALEALKKAEIFIENGVEYGFIRLPEKPDPALDTLPKIKAAIAALTNEGTKPVDVAAVLNSAALIVEGRSTAINSDLIQKLAKKNVHEIAVLIAEHDKELGAAIRALSSAPTTEAGK